MLETVQPKNNNWLESCFEKNNPPRSERAMYQKYTIELSDEERQHLEKLTFSGIASARMVKRAQILLESDSKGERTAWKYDQICAAFNVTPVTV